MPADSFLSSNTARDARFTCGRRYPSHLPSSSAGAHTSAPPPHAVPNDERRPPPAAGGPAGAAAGAAFAPACGFRHSRLQTLALVCPFWKVADAEAEGRERSDVCRALAST